MTITAQLAPMLSRTYRHAARGVMEVSHIEAAIMLSGSIKDLKEIASISVGRHDVRFDWGAMLAYHVGQHADPAIIFERDGGHHVQVFFHGILPEELQFDTVRAELTHGRGARLYPLMGNPSKDPEETINSRMERHQGGRHVLTVEAQDEFELVWQSVCDGASVETRVEYPAGIHSIPVPPAFGDYHGVCVSTSPLVGGVEHKHMIFGQFGMGSGRHLLVGNRLFAPKSTIPYDYQALVVHYRPDLEPDEDFWIGFDEVEIWSHIADVDAAKRVSESVGIPVRCRTYARFEDEQAEDADVVVVRCGQELVDKTYSYFLFADQADPEFASRLRDVIERRETTYGAKLLDRSWLSSVVGEMSGATGGEYGIAFSYPSMERLPDLELPRCRAVNLRRRVLQTSACHSCKARIRCDNILAMPWPDGIIPVPGDNCWLAHSLTNRIGDDPLFASKDHA